jgi:hydroxymethylpyrimidine pyrophosphatase-like HAD family hydrolase
MLTIAVDFDGTIVEHAYPRVGKEMPFAFDTLKKLREHRCRLILWTFRTGKELDEAVAYCREKGIEFYAVNKNYPEEVVDRSTGRKINADIYIDDKNLGGFPGWGEAWQMIAPMMGVQPDGQYARYQQKASWIRRLFGSSR